jgi:hypothetical protein
MEEAGSPYLVPLSVPWDGITSNMVTPSCSQTGRNLQATDKAYLGSARSTSSYEADTGSSPARESGNPHYRPGGADDMNTTPRGDHPQLETLPAWPTKTIAVLATIDHAPHAIPVSAPVRAGDRRILLNLKRTRGSRARLRERPQVALLVLAAGNLAFTAYGTARVAEEPMEAESGPTARSSAHWARASRL